MKHSYWCSASREFPGPSRIRSAEELEPDIAWEIVDMIVLKARFNFRVISPEMLLQDALSVKCTKLAFCQS